MLKYRSLTLSHRIGLFCGLAVLFISSSPGATISYFAVWGKGRWTGAIRVLDGRLVNATPYSFEPQYGDQFEGTGQEPRWLTGVSTGADGVTFTVEADGPHTLVLKIAEESIHITSAELGGDTCRVLRPSSGNPEAIVVGQGDVNRVPDSLRTMSLPDRAQLPSPPDHIRSLPTDWHTQNAPLILHLATERACELRIRRFGMGDGLLYLEISRQDGPLPDIVRLSLGNWTTSATAIHNQRLWLSLEPYFGYLEVRVQGADSALSETTTPTTLVETRGTQLYLNAEPFLVKGTLPRNMPDSDGAFLKALGANTIRVRDVTVAERHQFMAIVVAHMGPGRICEADTCPTDERFFDAAEYYLDNVRERVPWAATSPNTLIVQLGNEQITGADPWQKFFGEVHPIERLDWLLTAAWNIGKPLAPMLPFGYSNCAFGYRAPDFLDLYLHNTYLAKDRNWPPLADFMAFQGCDRRPYVHTEFGANRYMPQACIGGRNSPVLEKIHAWNYPNRWAEYSEAGTCGGTNYCMYDYDPTTVGPDSWDKGFTNFGIMTMHRNPKLACWELWHIWRDFELKPGVSRQKIEFTYRREYWARNAVLTIEDTTGTRTVALSDISPRENRTLPLPGESPWLRWQIDYTTHRGLPMIAMGVWPPEREKGAFLELIADRQTGPFLRELMGTEVVSADGSPAPRTLKEMERDDRTVVVGFRKPDGVTYLTCFSTRRPKQGLYHENTSIDVAFAGSVSRVDEWTGLEIPEQTTCEAVPGGSRIHGIRVPHISPSYGHRSRQPVELPVFRVTPAGAPPPASRRPTDEPAFPWRILRSPPSLPVRKLPQQERCVVNMWVAFPNQPEAPVASWESVRGLGKLKLTKTRDGCPALNCRGNVGAAWRRFSFTFRATRTTDAQLRFGGQWFRQPPADGEAPQWTEKYALLDDITILADDQALCESGFERGLTSIPEARMRGEASVTRHPGWVHQGEAAAIVSYNHYLMVPVTLVEGKVYTVSAFYRAKPDGFLAAPQE